MISALRVRGPFRGPTGYDRHVRAFVRELVAQGVAVQLIDVPGWGPLLPEELRDPWFEPLVTAQVDDGITLHFTMPDKVVPHGRSRDVNYTMFEATRICRRWLEHNLRHELVVVPTESSRAAWIASGFPPERVRLCPLGIDAERFGGARPLRLRTAAGQPLVSYRTRFLNVSELGPRKNLVGLLAAWLAATEADDDAVLVIKLSRNAPGWFELLQQQLEALERRTGKRFERAAPVEVLFDVLADAELPRLYAAATHYISLSHGEGWDQPMVEAAVSGLRLIAPDHSAYRAYLTPESALMLPSREVPARFAGDPWLQELFAGANWWEPDHDAAVAAIRTAIAGGGPASDPARARITANFSWRASTRRLIELLSEIEARARR